ncbi:hypothetical protein SPRG_10398 [Saprolegnia parasitica CBS 223.65]|uniref:Uncharacterized protein n=1 Tax=Saprolegnia parasitica (strain CBS 223.65) TaxID=695850 RepID=A0A067C1D0_SAPPC|nr:hypothetical protein SPRG_10398 [Saprolegnia parasitica CBS 223.65]KDO24323.1 hypothetical protein SPRG_10398 [Saprolegnia parasitica CBS 223.65]|eukprot:XP_012204920.1 hypothetical protein SPRG_10398 [Saprolegnia parasitica CBS 223.65]
MTDHADTTVPGQDKHHDLLTLHGHNPMPLAKLNEPRPIESDSDDDEAVNARITWRAATDAKLQASTVVAHTAVAVAGDATCVCIDPQASLEADRRAAASIDLQRTEAQASRREKEAVLHAKVADAHTKVAEAEAVARRRIEDQARLDEASRKAEEEAELAAFRAQLDATREARREAAERHDQKVLEAVLAASLYEYNEHQRIEKQLHDAEAEIERTRTLNLAELDRIRAHAAAVKQASRDAVAASQAKAQRLADEAAKAVHTYQETEVHRQEALLHLSTQESERDMEAQLHALHMRQEAATLRRIESERMAQAAQARAAQLRDEAIAKVKQVRELSKQKVASDLLHEDELRDHHYETQLQALSLEKAQATQRRIEREQAAEAAQARAVQLRNDAVAKARQVRAMSKQQIGLQLEREESIRELSYETQVTHLHAEKDAATRHRIEAEEKAATALARAASLQSQAMAAATKARAGSTSLLHADEIRQPAAFLSTPESPRTSLNEPRSAVLEHESSRAIVEMATKPVSVRPSSLASTDVTIDTTTAPESTTSVATAAPERRRPSRDAKKKAKDKKCAIM